MNKNFLTAIILFMSCCHVFGQISTDEEPISFHMNIPALQRSESVQKVMPLLDMKKIEQEDKEDETNGMPPRFGYRHEVNYNLDNSGEWTVLPDGSRIWRLSISCSGALSINLLYDKFWIPDDAKFFVYSNDRKHSIGAFTSINNKGDSKNIQGFATGLVYGNEITLEYWLPKSINETGIISVAYVVHGYRYIYLSESNTKSYGGSGGCQVNINCSEGQNWQNEKNAIAMILVNGNRYCTGSLVNTTANDYRPLFLTADHCLGGWANDVKGDAVTAPNLSHWSFYWHYESPGCTNTVPTTLSTSGATVVANNGASDFALLQLTEDQRNKTGVTSYYLGWDRTGNSGTGGVGIHHPSGDVKKIATHNITPPSNSNCMNYTNDYGVYMSNSSFWKINWMATTHGYSVTEGGSSGSPLLNSNHRVIGQLYGAGYCSNPNCSNPSADIANYGKFSVSWTGNGATDNRRKLQSWLDPNNTNAMTLDGIDICPTLVNFTNRIVTTNTTVISCGDINVENVTVKNGAKLTLDAAGAVNIGNNFEVEENSEFEIIDN